MKEQWYYNYEVIYWSRFDEKTHRAKGIVAGENCNEALAALLRTYEEEDNIDRIHIDVIDDSEYTLETSNEVF